LTASRISGPHHDADLVREVGLAKARHTSFRKGRAIVGAAQGGSGSAIPDVKLIHPGVSDLDRETPFGNSTGILSVVVAHLHCAESRSPKPGRDRDRVGRNGAVAPALNGATAAGRKQERADEVSALSLLVRCARVTRSTRECSYSCNPTARAFWSLLAAPPRLVDARDLYSHDYTRRSMGN